MNLIYNNKNHMGFFDNINGYNRKLKDAKALYDQGLYRDAIKALDASQIQVSLMSKDQYCISEFIAASCFKELGDKNAALRCLSRIIDYPGYNHKYISKAEALKQSIQRSL